MFAQTGPGTSIRNARKRFLLTLLRHHFHRERLATPPHLCSSSIPGPHEDDSLALLAFFAPSSGFGVAETSSVTFLKSAYGYWDRGNLGLD